MVSKNEAGVKIRLTDTSFRHLANRNAASISSMSTQSEETVEGNSTDSYGSDSDTSASIEESDGLDDWIRTSANVSSGGDEDNYEDSDDLDDSDSTSDDPVDEVDEHNEARGKFETIQEEISPASSESNHSQSSADKSDGTETDNSEAEEPTIESDSGTSPLHPAREKSADPSETTTSLKPPDRMSSVSQSEGDPSDGEDDANVENDTEQPNSTRDPPAADFSNHGTEEPREDSEKSEEASLSTMENEPATGSDAGSSPLHPAREKSIDPAETRTSLKPPDRISSVSEQEGDPMDEADDASVENEMEQRESMRDPPGADLSNHETEERRTDSENSEQENSEESSVSTMENELDEKEGSRFMWCCCRAIPDNLVRFVTYVLWLKLDEKDYPEPRQDVQTGQAPLQTEVESIS